MTHWPAMLSLLLAVVLSSGCSIRRFAMNKVADAIASGGDTYQSDEDLELVGTALPFGLKLMESLLNESPRHRGLLQASCLGFTSYSYLYVHQAADRAAESDLEQANRLRTRAQRLYERGHRLCLRGLEISYQGISDRLFQNPAQAVAAFQPKDVPLLYWTAASLGLSISMARGDAAKLARLPEVDALLARALELDEDWDNGALHEFRVSFASASPGTPDYSRIQTHYERALELSKGQRAALHVSYAEAVAVPRQDRTQFEELLDKALAVNPDENISVRLANLAAQQRARWLLERQDELILGPDEPGGEAQQ